MKIADLFDRPVARSRRHLAIAAWTIALLLFSGQVDGASWIVPGVTSVSGINGYYSSELTVVNPGATDRVVTLSLIPGFGTRTPIPRSYTVAAGSTLWLGNVFGIWLLEGTGALRIVSDGPVTLFARTTTEAPVARIPEDPPPTFGGSLPVIEEAQLLGPAETGHSPWVTQSPNRTTGQRTNFAVVFPDASGGAATVTLFDDQGTSLGTVSYDVPQAAFLQQSLTAFTSSGISAGRLAVNVTRGHACGYSAVVDNGTGDPMFFSADRTPTGEHFDALSNGVAQTLGRDGTFWQTEARLANPSAHEVSVAAYLLGGSGQPQRGDLRVPAGKTIAIPSLLTSLFHLSGSATGSVLWRASGPLLIATRVSAQASLLFGIGTIGAGRSAVPLDAFLTQADGPADLLVEVGIWFRTNILIAAGPAGSTYTLELRDRNNRVLGSLRQTLGPLGWTEFSLADLIPAPPQERLARLRVVIESGSANVQAALVDPTSDLVLFEAFPRGSKPSSTPPIIPGLWGSADGAEGLKIDSEKIVVERWCQGGTFSQPNRLDPQGRFSVLGTYGGQLGPSFSFTAILTGQADGLTVTVSVLDMDQGTVWSPPRTYAFGQPYQIPTGPCPVVY